MTLVFHFHCCSTALTEINSPNSVLICYSWGGGIVLLHARNFGYALDDALRRMFFSPLISSFKFCQEGIEVKKQSSFLDLKFETNSDD